MIRHVSFDFWNTLARPNPEFAAERDRMLSHITGESPEKVRAVYRACKTFLDATAEAAGNGQSTDAAYAFFFRTLTGGVADHATLTKLANGFRDAFWLQPPLIEPSTLGALEALAEKGCSISVLSNTNFIGGHLLSKLLDIRSLNLIKFQLYSDQHAVSKPHPAFFDLLADYGTSLGRARERIEILHVGDNRVCDGAAAEHGMQFLYVRDPSETDSVPHRINVKEIA